VPRVQRHGPLDCKVSGKEVPNVRSTRPFRERMQQGPKLEPRRQPTEKGSPQQLPHISPRGTTASPKGPKPKSHCCRSTITVGTLGTLAARPTARTRAKLSRGRSQIDPPDPKQSLSSEESAARPGTAARDAPRAEVFPSHTPREGHPPRARGMLLATCVRELSNW
jgi:hypothetical protein